MPACACCGLIVFFGLCDLTSVCWLLLASSLHKQFAEGRELVPWLHAGDMGGLGVSNIRHAMNINDVVSDTVHQFAPTYHSYVLYSNSGARNAPKTVRPKEVFVLPEAPNKFHDNANLLANMELGVHSDDAQRTRSDQEEGSAQQHAHDDALYRANTFSDVDDDDFRAGPLEESEVMPRHDCLGGSPIHLAHVVRSPLHQKVVYGVHAWGAKAESSNSCRAVCLLIEQP